MNAPSVASAVAAARLTLLAAALLAAWPPARAQEDEEVARFVTPASTVAAGLGLVSEENTRFGQYTGMVDKRWYPLLDLTFRRRSADGLWLNATGRDLGLDSREVRLEASRQGDWGISAEFTQTPRFSPYTPITRLTSSDSARQAVNGAPVAVPLEMSTERRALSLGFEKLLGRSIDVQVRMRNEDKTGRRLFGRTGTDFLVDPIDYNTQMLEATAGYTGERLQLSGGYTATNFANAKTKLDVTGGTGTFTPIALPSGNQSHQLSLSGGYGITPATRATFRLARTFQTQTEAFIDTPAAATQRTNLGGRVDSTFGQVGITSRVTPSISLLGNLRYDNRDDNTPVVDYFTTTAATTATGENEPRSVRARAAKLEATVRLPARFSVTGGADLEHRWRSTSSVRSVSYRAETDETSYRVDVRRVLSETLNGSLGYVTSRRTGSSWETNFLGNATGTGPSTTLGSNLLHPLHLADRERDKVRATLGWQATEVIDLSFLFDYSQDDYRGRTLGLTDGYARHHGVDAGFRLSDTWSATAWYSRDDTKARMRSCASAVATNTGAITACPNTAASPIWEADLRNVGNAIGAGLRGKPNATLEVGADLNWSQDRGEFRQAPRPATVTPVPDAHYLRATLRVFARQALTKTAGVRVQYVQDRFKTDDWTWINWTYSDGTRVLSSSSQVVHFIGVAGYIDF